MHDVLNTSDASDNIITADIEFNTTTPVQTNHDTQLETDLSDIV